MPKKERKKLQIDKAALVAAKNMSKKYKIPLMADDKKNFKIAKSTFNKLKTNRSSTAFAEETIDKKLLTKFKKSKYVENKKFFKLVNLLENSVIFEPNSVKRTDYVEKREVILHSIVLMLLFGYFTQT